MGEEPGGFHAALEQALNLAGGDTFLAGAHQMDYLKPQMQLEMRPFENSADPDSEGLLAGIALAETSAGGFSLKPTDPLAFATERANRTRRPQIALDVLESGFFAMEVIGGQNGMGHGLSPWHRS
jgi:hypothetical protein